MGGVLKPLRLIPKALTHSKNCRLTKRLVCLLCFVAVQGESLDDLASEIHDYRDKACSVMFLLAEDFAGDWRSASQSERYRRLVESVRILPKARGVPYSVTGDDVQMLANLCPELNLVDLSQSPEALLGLLEVRCHSDEHIQTKVLEDDMSLARHLSTTGKLASRDVSRMTDHVFHVKDSFLLEVSGPHPLNGEYISQLTLEPDAAGFVVEYEIWYAVLFRQHLLFGILEEILTDYKSGQMDRDTDSQSDEQCTDAPRTPSMPFILAGGAAVCLILGTVCYLTWKNCCQTRSLIDTPVKPDDLLTPPRDLCCPMSLELFEDPVVAADGETYERVYIESWIRERTAEIARQAATSETARPRRPPGILSPMGHGPLRHNKLVVNQAVRRLANQWREENGVKKRK